MSIRALQAALLSLAIAFGYAVWEDLPNPDLASLERIAEVPLQRVFGPDVRYQAIDVNVVDGVQVRDLRVPSLFGLSGDGDRPQALDAFTAEEIHLHTNPVALATGSVELTKVRVSGAKIIARETEDGIEPDFPFTLTRHGGAGPPPELLLEDAKFYVRSRPGSTRFAEGAVVVLYIDRLTIRPEAGSRLRLAGTVFTRQLDQDAEPLLISGLVDRDAGRLDLRIDVAHVELTQSLLALLHPDVAAPLRQQSVTGGRLRVKLEGRPGTDIRMQIEWDADLSVQVRDLPLPTMQEIEATTKQQLQELFGGGALKILVDQDEVRIDQLVTQMAGGRVAATGWIKQDTGALRIEFSIEDLELSDPAVRRALGKEGAEIFAQFSPSGVVDAKGVVTRSAEGEVAWAVDVMLEDASFEFIGAVEPSTGKREGFPYRVEQATGRIRIRPDGVYFDDIVGFHGGAEITVRGHDKRSWTGGETGRIKFADEGVDLRLTVEIVNMEVDEDVRAAVEGSEFAGLLDEFQIAGVIDRVEVDVVSVPGVDTTAKTEVRLQLEGEQFTYAPFPLPVEDVRGTITMRRPLLPGRSGAGNHRRGRVYAFSVDGWAEGSPLHIESEIVDHEDRGILKIVGDGVPLAGALTRTILESDTTKDGLAPVWRWLGPRGRADVVASLPLQDDPSPLSLETTLKGASIRLGAEDKEPALEISDLRGRLLVKDGDVTFDGVSGTLGGSRTTIAGSMKGGTEGVWSLDIQAESLRITPPLLGGLGRLAGPGGLLPEGLTLEPGGQLALGVKLSRAAGPDARLAMEVRARDIDVDVRVPDAGTVHITGEEIHVTKEAVRLTAIESAVPGLKVTMPAAVVPLGDAGAVQGEFRVTMDALELTPELRRLIPDRVADVLGTWTEDRLLSTEALTIRAPASGPVRIEGPLSLVAPKDTPVGDGPRGTVRFAPLLVSTDPAGTLLAGRVTFQGFSMDVGVELEEIYGSIHVDRLRLPASDAPAGTPRVPEGGTGRLVGLRGRVEGIRFSDLHAPVSWQEGIFRADPVRGRVVAGALEGHIVLFTRTPSAYEGAVRITGFDVGMLKEDLSPTGAPVTGTGTASVQFQNRGGTLHDLTAAGTIQIRDGSLGDLPFVANVFALGASILSSDNRPQFERADVEFVFRKEVFEFKRIDLAGPLFEMPGRGTLDTTGVVDLYFTPEFIKSLAVPGVMQLPVVGDILGATLREEFLYAVRLRGDLANAQTELVPFPALGIDFGSTFEGTGPRELPRRRLPRWFR